MAWKTLKNINSHKNEYDQRLKVLRSKYKGGRSHPDFMKLNRKIRDRYLHYGLLLKAKMKIKYGNGWKFAEEKLSRVKALDGRRKKEVKAICSRNVRRQNNQDYIKKSRKLVAKRNYYQQQIRRIKNRNESIKKMAQLVADFFELNKNSKHFPLRNLIETRGINSKKSESQKERTVLIRRIFFKYGMENGIMGKFLADYIGCCQHTVTRGRQALQRSFKTNKKNYDTWKRFLQFSKQSSN